MAGGVRRGAPPLHDERGAGRGGATTTPRSSATYYNEPGSPSSTFVDGPRFRAAEAEIERLRAGHAIEMEQMRVYLETLRAYGESLRRELEDANRALAEGSPPPR